MRKQIVQRQPVIPRLQRLGVQHEQRKVYSIAAQVV